jgi:GrpB-like predicted nucleotidyltransferase (UPF0157 family)
MPAKPIIDILIAVPRVREAAVSFVPRLEALGYAYWSGNPNHDRLFFVKGLPPTARRRTHHVHVAEPASEMWERLLFRDYLRAMPREAERYADLKRRLADRFASDREASTRGKHEFVRQMMDAARSWSEQALRSQEQGGCRPASS